MPAGMPRITSCSRRILAISLRFGFVLSFLLGPISHAKADAWAHRPTAAPSPPSASLVAQIVEQCGIASWYGRHWRGRRTASGARFDDRKLTAANLSLPLKTKARVTNLANGRSVEVIVNDRGPYVAGRIIDLSAGAAKALGMLRGGLADVAISAELNPARVIMR